MQATILNITASLPSRIEREATYGLHVYPLAEALLRSSAAFYVNHATEARACLYAIQDDAALANAVHKCGGEAYAGRLIGALESVGRRDVANSIRRGVNKFCEVGATDQATILKFDLSVARRSATPAAFACRQCIPASLHRAATADLQAGSMM